MTVDKPRGLSRRSFVKYAAVGGLAALGGYSALVYPSGLKKFIEYGQKPWEVALGVVDYRLVKDREGALDVRGVPEFYRTGPDDRRRLNVAQWYDYWPGAVINNFTAYMQEMFGLGGCEVVWTSNIYTSNEELFTWVSQTGRKFDVMVPTNYTVETMEKAGLIVNLNREWLPNYKCIFGPTPSDTSDITNWRGPAPARKYDSNYGAVPSYPDYAGYNNEKRFDFRTPDLNEYQYRSSPLTYPTPRGTEFFTWDDQNGLLAVPYQWGTTGIGYRSDIFRPADIEQLGWDVLELPSYTNPDYRDPITGQVGPRTFDLTKKKMMLDDMREVFTAALKDVGWKKQIEGNMTPTAQVRMQGEFQWSSNEKDDDKLLDAQAWLLSWRDTSWGFNTPQQGPWLVSQERYVNQAWSGDIMYAVRPNSSQFVPVDYFVPKQGGARWIDNLVVHRECEKLWLSHQFINYIQDPGVQADISAWNLYASPNAWSFDIMNKDRQTFDFAGQYKDGSPYRWNPTEDKRIYADFAVGYGDDPVAEPPILNRCEYQKDVGVSSTLRYFRYWRDVKF